MKKILLMLGVLALICSPAMAGKNAGGSMIVHTNDAVVYTGTGQYCGVDYDDPGSCENAGTQTDLLNIQAVIWFLAAFDPASNPGVSVCYFGDDTNLPPGEGWISAWGPCGPDGTLEVPDAGWPDNPATAGNSVAFGTPIAGVHLFPFYMFASWGFDGAYFGTGINPTGGYAGFESDDVPSIPDGTDRFGHVYWLAAGDNTCPEPPGATGACCYPDGTCEVVAEADCAGQYLGDDTVCDPNPCDQPGACCFLSDGHCEYVLEVNCQGDYFIADEFCDPNPCDQPTEACCFEDGSCADMGADDCTAAGGTPQGAGTDCANTDCPLPPTEACCFDDGSCADLLPDDCTAQGGTPMGAGTDCANTDCPPAAAEKTTRGSIKANHR